MRRILRLVALLALIGAAAAFWVTQPQPLPAAALAGLTGDAVNGERVFHLSGCASCHAAPGAEGEARLVLAGGERFETAFGTFVAPNISTDADHGIGGWTLPQFANAVMRGLSPEGAHYYPAFPYAAYSRATPQDIADLWAFWQGLPASDTPSVPHDLAPPWSIRRAVGVWKWLYMPTDWVVAGTLSQEARRGRYLVEVLGHCAECHTARDGLGGLVTARWLAGAPNPSGRGSIPNITPAALDWSAEDIAIYLSSGFTPEFDVVGGSMAHVVENLAQVPEEDRLAIAAYLAAVPPAE